MSAYDAAILLLFPGLGLVALAIGLLVRRYSVKALVVGLVGLFVLAAASTWITAARPPMDSAIEKPLQIKEEPKENIAAEKPQTGGSKMSRSEPSPNGVPAAPQQQSNSDVERLGKELQDERSKRVEAERNAAEVLRRVADATTKIAQLDDAVSKFQTGKAEAERQAALLEEKMRGIQPPASPPDLPDLQIIRSRLTDGNPPHYAAQQVQSMIHGRKGSWYVIRLQDGGRDWSFADRQFVLGDATEIKKSMARLRDDVLAPLTQRGQQWSLFVRGAADARPVAGPVGRELTYLPRKSDGTYALKAISKRVTVPVQNEELPTLRADWLRGIIRTVLGPVESGSIELLENPPQPEHGRTAELVLFVEW